MKCTIIRNLEPVGCDTLNFGTIHHAIDIIILYGEQNIVAMGDYSIILVNTCIVIFLLSLYYNVNVFDINSL